MLESYDRLLAPLGRFGEHAQPLLTSRDGSTVILGVGAIGLRTVVRVRAMLHRMFTQETLESSLQLLAIARSQTFGEQMALLDDECVTIEPPMITAWADVVRYFAQDDVAAWWPYTPNAKTALEHPRSTRVFNRLNLLHNARRICDGLDAKLRWLRDGQQAGRIFVVGSLGEAEGSGILLDIAAYLRTNTHDLEIPITGLFSLRGGLSADDPDHILEMAHGFASLQEIDAFTAYPGLFAPLLTPQLQSKPFDTVLLTDHATALTTEPPEDALAEAVVTWLASTSGRAENDLVLYNNEHTWGVFGISKTTVFTPANYPLLVQAAAPPLATTGSTQAACQIIRASAALQESLGPERKKFPRIVIPSPDPDELAVMCVEHNVALRDIPALCEVYSWAYEQAEADGFPLHLDRRLTAALPDFCHPAQTRIVLPDQTIDVLGTALGALSIQPITEEIPFDLHLAVYELPPRRRKLLPSQCVVGMVEPGRAAQDVGNDLLQALMRLVRDDQFVLIINTGQRPNMDQVIAPLQESGFTTFVLTDQDLEMLTRAPAPRDALDELVLNRISLGSASPFYTRAPVPDNMFFGRDREVREIMSRLHTHSIALIGGRRIGKTSIVTWLYRRFQKDASGYVPYYLDGHNSRDYASFFRMALRQWDLPRDSDTEPASFETVVETLQARHPDRLPVFLFDEVDQLLDYDHQHDDALFRTFRKLSDTSRCRFVFVGERWLMRASTDPYSVLSGFAQPVLLEPVSQRVIREMVLEPFRQLNIWVADSDKIVEEIYQISAGHPNIAQIVCDALLHTLEAGNRRTHLLTYDHLVRVKRQREIQEQIVTTIWGQMNPLSKLITLIWPLPNEPDQAQVMSLSDLEHHLRELGLKHLTTSDLREAVWQLDLYRFVRTRSDDRLELVPVTFPTILSYMTDKVRQVDSLRNEIMSRAVRPKVFLSHSSKDDTFVTQLAADLQKNGIDTWVDHQNISAGYNWNREIDRALEASSALVFVATNHALASKECENEWSFVLDRLQVVPILCEPGARLPRRLHMLQWIDFTGDYNNALTLLVNALTNKPPE